MVVAKKDDGYDSLRFLQPIEAQLRRDGRTSTSTRTHLYVVLLMPCLFLLALLSGAPGRRRLSTIGESLWPTSCRTHPASTVEERVKRILTETPLIDGHNDLAIFIRYMYKNHINDETFTKPFERGGMPLNVDLNRLRAGLNGGAFWSVYVNCPANTTDFSDANYANSVRDTLQQIDLMSRLVAAYPDDFSGAVNSSDALAAFRRGQLISPLGVEGLHQIGNYAANLRRFHSLGARYATLTHNCHNRFADAAVVKARKAEPLWGGVSPEGRRMVKEMNRIGMIVDLSHVSADTMVDVLGGKDDWEGSRAPVIFSHSSAYALCPHPRNVEDRVLQLVKERKSLVMINFLPDFVSCVEPADGVGDGSGIPEFYPPNSTLEHVAEHILHVGNLIGFDHVGLGSDFGTLTTTPRGLEDVSKFPDLVAELLRRGVSDEDAAKIVGGNILRVWADVDAVALEMQAAGEPPLEDDLPDLKYEYAFGAHV